MSRTEGKAGPLSRFLPEDRPGADRRARRDPGRVGEVIESSTTALVAEACELHGAPAFGSFVRVQAAQPIVGVVFDAYTHSIEPNRRPAAYGRTEEELRREQPQIFALLRTEFQALVIGYLEEGRPMPLLPPQPARIHSFVHLCGDEEVRAFTRTNEYLRRILGSSGLPADELVVAVLRRAVRAWGGDREFLVRAGKDLSRLLGDDYDRLSSIVRRIAL